MIAMKNILERSLYGTVAAVALMLVTTNPLAATPATTPFNMTGVGSGTVLAGVYTSPYTATIGSSTGIPVICDDFADETYIPEQWTAYATTLSTLTSGTPDTYLKWLTSGTITVDGYTLNQAAAYTVAAVLATDITTSVAGSTAQQDYSYALWGLFDPCGSGIYSGTAGCTTPGSPADPGAFGQLANYGLQSSNEAQAITYLNAAVVNVETNNLTPSNFSNITIYSYDSANGTSCGSGSCPPPPQEFITVSMAEAPSPAILGVDLLGLIGLALIARRRGWLAQ
jgi:hypothetical protein